MDISDVLTSFTTSNSQRTNRRNSLNVVVGAENTTAGFSTDSFQSLIKPSVSDKFINIAEMLEENKEDKLLSDATKKALNGEELTKEELEILRKKNPVLYVIAMQTKAVREAFEAQLKNCKSKEEVQNLMFMQTITSLKNIKAAKADGDAIEEARQKAFLMAMQEVYQEFIKSDEYLKLPQKTKDEDRFESLIDKLIDLTLETLDEEFKEELENIQELEVEVDIDIDLEIGIDVTTINATSINATREEKQKEENKEKLA